MQRHFEKKTKGLSLKDQIFWNTCFHGKQAMLFFCQTHLLLTIGLEPITNKEQILSLSCLPISPSKHRTKKPEQDEHSLLRCAARQAEHFLPWEASNASHSLLRCVARQAKHFLPWEASNASYCTRNFAYISSFQTKNW